MGSILIYKILQRIEKLRLPPPIHAFFSGRRAPHMPSRKAVSHSKMNKEELENEILSLGGTPPEFFRYPELRNIFLPIIRSDFKIADTLVQKSEITQLDSDISILIGKDEDILAKEAKEWSLCTVRDCSINYFDGGHFFVLNQQKSVIDLINSCLIQRYSKEIV
jgi:surfactin synthase thioesterase subunit